MGRLPIPPGTAGEVHIKQVGARWHARCRYRHEDGTYVDVRRRASSRDKARNAVRDALKELTGTTPGASVTARSKFADVADLWLAQYRIDADNGIYSLGSVDTYSDHLRNHVLPRLGSLRLIEIQPHVINKLCQDKLKAYSLSLAKHTKAVVSNVFTYAVQAGALESNPTREIAPLSERRAKHKRKKPRALTAEQVLDFFAKLDQDEEAVRHDLPDLVRFFVATGHRRGEALGAHWSDFDEGAQLLTMTGNLISARGRGVVRNQGKSETSERSISLPAWCVEMLKQRREAMGPVNPDVPIFANSKGGYLNASNLTNRHWAPFRQRAGYEWVTFHTFRKTVGTLLDEAGLTARQIADVLGHSQPSMTLNSYMGRGQVSRDSANALDSVVTRKAT